MTDEMPNIDDIPGIMPEGQYTDEELNSLDGFRIKIAEAKVVSADVKYGEEFGTMLPEGETRKVFRVEVKSEPFAIPSSARETTITEKFSLKKNKAGEWGVSLHEKSKSKKLFNKLGISKFPESIGKEIVIVKKVSERGTKYPVFSI